MESKKSKQKKGYVVRYRYGTVPYRTVQIVNYFFKKYVPYVRYTYVLVIMWITYFTVRYQYLNRHRKLINFHPFFYTVPVSYFSSKQYQHIFGKTLFFFFSFYLGRCMIFYLRKKVRICNM